jgi:SM-20-related protein
LVLYRSDADQDPIHVTPAFGTVMAFLSEELHHEALPAWRDRY